MLEVRPFVLDYLNNLALMVEKLANVGGIKAEAVHSHLLLAVDAVLHLGEELVHGDPEIIQKVLLPVINLPLILGRGLEHLFLLLAD